MSVPLVSTYHICSWFSGGRTLLHCWALIPLRGQGPEEKYRLIDAVTATTVLPTSHATGGDGGRCSHRLTCRCGEIQKEEGGYYRTTPSPASASPMR